MEIYEMDDNGSQRTSKALANCCSTMFNLGICCPITLQQITPRTSDGTLLLDTMVVFIESKWDKFWYILHHSTNLKKT